MRVKLHVRAVSDLWAISCQPQQSRTPASDVRIKAFRAQYASVLWFQRPFIVLITGLYSEAFSFPVWGRISPWFLCLKPGHILETLEEISELLGSSFAFPRETGCEPLQAKERKIPNPWYCHRSWCLSNFHISDLFCASASQGGCYYHADRCRSWGSGKVNGLPKVTKQRWWGQTSVSWDFI